MLRPTPSTAVEVRRPQPLRAAILLALSLLLALPAAVWAQDAETGAPARDGDAPRQPEQQAEQGEIFFDALSVNVVNVDVFVTDGKGEPVTGLTKDDFELYEDGRQVEVTNFYAVAGEPVTTGTSARVADLPTDDPDAPAPLPVPEERPAEQRLNLVVYVDNLFISPFERNTVIREVDRFLHFNTRPGDQVMLVSFDRTLNVRQPFTRDIRLVGRAMKELMDVRAFGEQAKTERRDLMKRVETTETVNQALNHVDFYAKSVYHDVEVSLRALSDLVGSLGGLPGRKALLFVSEGIPMTAGEDLFSLVDLKYGQRASSQLLANRYRVRREFRHIVARANSNRVTFYTLDAAGRYTHSGISAEYGGLDRSFSEIDFVYDANRHEPMQIMADGTGGQAVIGTANFSDALERVGTDFSHYYSLGYTPTHADDGRYHDVEVRVKGRRDLEVRHREGYRTKSMETRLNDGTVAALLYEASVNPMDVRLDFGRPEPDDRGNYLVPVEVKIPIGEMALLPRGTEHQGRMRVSLSVMDDDGDTSPPSQTPFSVVVPDGELEEARGTHYTYTAQLLMRRGVHQVAAGVVDEIAGSTSFVRRAVRVGG